MLLVQVLRLLALKFLPAALQPFVPFVSGLLEGIDLNPNDHEALEKIMAKFTEVLTRMNDAIEQGADEDALELVRITAEIQITAELRNLGLLRGVA